MRTKKPEFETALHYLKPDIVCGTESWLEGIKPGENPKRGAIKSNEIFPQNYNVYRNDRGTLGGGDFVLVEKSPTSVEQTQFITDGELEWVNIKLLKNKDLLVGSLYMPHREHQHVYQLKLSLERSEANKQNIILAGDFNCHNINWEQQTATGSDREIQQYIYNSSIINQLEKETCLTLSLSQILHWSNHQRMYQEYQTTTSS